MWQAAGDAVRAAGRFTRHHRRAIVFGGVVGAAAYAFHTMKKAIKDAEEEEQLLLQRAGEAARYRQCLGRTRGECVAALANFLPALRKRLFLAVDVTGPVRELKALRGVGGISSEGGAGADGDKDAADSAAQADLESREIELWEKVKVTALTRLVVSLYAFNALALMLHVQLHILGRMALEESQKFLRRAEEDSSPVRSSVVAPPPPSRSGRTQQGVATPSLDVDGSFRGAGPLGANADIRGGVESQGGEGAAGLSMQAKHALLAATYEHVLGAGLHALVQDVERAVARCTSSWHAHTRQEIAFQDLVVALRKVRRDIEGPIGGTGYSGGGGGAGGTGRAAHLFGRPSDTTHSLLLRYIINPSDGIDGGEYFQARNQPVGGARSGGVVDEAFVDSVEAVRQLPGVGDVLDETWDTAESPNFAAALQGCLDATFSMVYEQIRQKAFCRATSGSQQRRVIGRDRDGGTEVTNEERTVSQSGSNQHAAAAPTSASSGSSRVAVGSPPGADEGVGVAGGGEMLGAGAVTETEECLQVLATVISQAKLVVGDVLEPSARDNEYVLAVAALPSVQDLCISVFESSRFRDPMQQQEEQQEQQRQMLRFQPPSLATTTHAGQ